MRKNCKLAGKEAHYSTGLDWRVTHIRLERWNEKEKRKLGVQG